MQHKLSVFCPVYKEHGNHHSSPHNKKKNEQIENQQFFLDPSVNCRCRKKKKQCFQKQRHRKEEVLNHNLLEQKPMDK